jgi:hypothetical protein
MVGVSREHVSSLDSVPAGGYSFDLVVPRSLDVEDNLGSLPGVENTSELFSRVAGNVLIGGRHAEPNAACRSRSAVQDLQDPITVALDEKLDAEKWLLGKEPLSSIQPYAGPRCGRRERGESDSQQGDPHRYGCCRLRHFSASRSLAVT